MRTLDVLRENSRTQAIDRIVSHLDCLLFRLEGSNDDKGSKDLLFVDIHLGLNVRENGGLDKVSLSITDIREALSAANQLRALVLAGLGEAEDALVLHFGDLRALACVGFEGVTDDLDIGDVFGEVSNELIIDALLDKNAGCGAADLALVVKDTDVLCVLGCAAFAWNPGKNLQPI